jgi:hypothetical protein
MSEVYLQQSPENLRQIEALAGNNKPTLEDFLHLHKEVYVAYLDRSNRYIQNSQGFLPSPQKVGENGNKFVIQLPEKNIVIVGIIQKLNQIPQIIILEALQRHSIYSIVDRKGNYIRDNKNWDHPKTIEIPNDTRSVKAETYDSVLVPARDLRGEAQYYSHNPINGGQIVNTVPKEGYVVQSYQGKNIKEGILIQGGEGVVAETKLNRI